MNRPVESTGHTRQKADWRDLVAIFPWAALPRLAYLALARPPFTYDYWEMAGVLLSIVDCGVFAWYAMALERACR